MHAIYHDKDSKTALERLLTCKETVYKDIHIHVLIFKTVEATRRHVESTRQQRLDYDRTSSIFPMKLSSTRVKLLSHSCEDYQKHQYAASDVLTIVGEDTRISTRQIKSIGKRAHL